MKKTLEKFGLKNNVIDRLTKFKLRLPPSISTGSEMGNLFEAVYIVALVVVVIIAYRTCGPAIRII